MNRVDQTVGTITPDYALDVAASLPEVIYTTEGNIYLHLPGVIVAESSTGETRYLLSDGLGSIRQAVDETGALVAYNEFDPYGNPVQNDSKPYGFTGEWWEDQVGLLHLRARWYLAYLNRFISPDTLAPATASAKQTALARLCPRYRRLSAGHLHHHAVSQLQLINPKEPKSV